MGTISVSLPSDGQTIDAADYNTPINTIVSEINGGLDNANIAADAAIDRTKITGLSDGWETGLDDVPDTITNNGNRSYDLVFNSTDLTDTVSEGMRVRTTRSSAAPDQCADLEASSSQYFSKSSPTGMPTGTTISVMGWIKLESYTGSIQIITERRDATGGFILRVDTSGLLQILAGESSAFDVLASYQSIPLDRWVHVAGSLTINSGGNLYIDGVDVPAQYTNTAATAIANSGDFRIGTRYDTTQYFDGKIAQVGVFDAVLSEATIQSYASQGLSGSETNCVGAWSLDNDITDLNSNGNDLTANGGAVATDTDSPFGNLGVSTTLDYGIITAASFSTNTTLTVQVPEGCTIPTSGGVSAVAYSTNSTPYGFVRDSGRWVIETLNLVQGRKTTPVAGTWYNLAGQQVMGNSLTIPVGTWNVGYTAEVQQNGSGAAAGDFYITLSTGAATESDELFTLASTANSATQAASFYKRRYIKLTSATEYFLNEKAVTLLTSPNLYLRGDTSPTVIFAECSYL